jgi:hypothetical protein
MRFENLWRAAVASAALAGCSALGVSIVSDQQGGIFLPGEYAYDASRGDIPVVVTGGAFGLDPRTFANVVVHNMQGSDWPPHARFVASSGPTTARVYSYVMMFNGPRDVTSAVLCANPRQPRPVAATASTDGAIILVAGLCRYDKVASGVTARGAARSADDPQFHTLIASAVQELTRPNQRRGGSRSSDGGGRGS